MGAKNGGLIPKRYGNVNKVADDFRKHWLDVSKYQEIDCPCCYENTPNKMRRKMARAKFKESTRHLIEDKFIVSKAFKLKCSNLIKTKIGRRRYIYFLELNDGFSEGFWGFIK